MSTYDVDVIIYDEKGAPQPWDKTKPLGGSEMGMLLLKSELEAQGVKTLIADTRFTYPMQCQTLIIHRASHVPPWIRADHTVVVVQDAEPGPYRHLCNLPHVFVSDWQCTQFGQRGRGTIIKPMIQDAALALRGTTKITGRHLYAAAVNKGLHSTLRCWSTRPKDYTGYLCVTTTGYDEPDQATKDEMERLGVRWLGLRTPMGLAEEIARAETFFYINTYPECFPVTVALARALDCRMILACQGHATCGIEEAAKAQDLSCATQMPKWMGFLRL